MAIVRTTRQIWPPQGGVVIPAGGIRDIPEAELRRLPKDAYVRVREPGAGSREPGTKPETRNAQLLPGQAGYRTEPVMAGTRNTAAKSG